MNYQKIYNEIITKAQSQVRTKDVDYYENHHIIPSSLGGKDTNNNIVLLTAREHFICHWLLYKMTSGVDKNKMAHAWYSMCRRSDGQKREKITSRKYEYARRSHAEAAKFFHKNRKLSEKELHRRKHNNPRARRVIFRDVCFTCVRNAARHFNVQPSIIRKVESEELPYQYLYDLDFRQKYNGSRISKSLKGKNKGKTYEEMYGIETAEKLKEERRKARTGYKLREETRKKISESRMGKSSWNKGKTFSKETCKRISEARKGKSNNKLKYTVITPSNEHIDIDESVGLRKWLKDTYDEKICTSIKTSLKIGESVQRGKWKGYTFYAEPRNRAD